MRQRVVRDDVAVQVRRDAGRSGVVVVIGERPSPIARATPEEALQELAVLLEREIARAVERGRERLADPGAVALPRVTFDVRAPELAWFSWEDAAATAAAKTNASCSIVRVSPVRPRFGDQPFTLPLRMAMIDQRDPGLASAVRSVFDRFPPGETEAAFEVEDIGAHDVEIFREKLMWPTAEVLHFGFGARWSEPEAASTASPDQPITLGWLLRLATTWETRLVAFDCPHEHHGAARTLAQAVVDRGGPAVLVADGQDFDFSHCYAAILHDYALDEAVLPLSAVGPRPALFAGSGREDSLRVSNVAAGLVALTADLTTAFDRGVDSDVVREVFEKMGRGTAARDPVGDILNVLSEDVHSKWEGLDFREHEGGGLMPIAGALRRVRRMTGSRPQPAERASVAGARHVNSRLATVHADGKLGRLEQEGARLVEGAVYQLAIQVGPRDETVTVFGASALLEEHFQWGPGVEGRWLEVGVTGLDFDVVGDPVQEVWLPKEGVSDEVAFAIVPRRPGVLRLRFCVYVDQCLLQSFRLAAVAVAGDESLPEDAGAQLARVLEVPVEEVGSAGYKARLEYAAAASADSMLEAPRRTLSIFANDLDGESVITVKAAGSFSVGTDTDLGEYVTRARRTLEKLALGPGSTDENPEYAFHGATNAGNEDQLRDALAKLAEAGCELFGRVASGSTGEIAAALAGKRGVVRVGHLLLKNVIPWALVYDRPYDADRRIYEDKPVAHDACLAPLGADGAVRACGEHPACPLHADRVTAREAAGEPSLLKSTVACPLHLWGFRHVIEVPPRHLSGAEEPADQGDCIAVQTPSRVSVATNDTLVLAASHRGALQSLCGELGIASGLTMASERDTVIDNLDDSLLNVVYFYCHAIRGVPQGDAAIPRLVFPYADGSEGMISATDFEGGARWTTGPLVFLNGCRTAGFTPDALSPFVETFVKGRGAGGFLGTEVPVWEQVATDLALRFLRSFLNGAPAGLALLEARRSLLLEKLNPLGLAYTLFGSADLALDLDGDGECEKIPVDT